MADASECISRRASSGEVEKATGEIEFKECKACKGFGLELRANGEGDCRFCEGRGWVLSVECCSCGRPAAMIAEKANDKFALCERDECEEKFEKLSWWEFEKIEEEEDFEDRLGWGW